MKKLLIVILFIITPFLSKSQNCYANFGFYLNASNAGFYPLSSLELVGDAVHTYHWDFGDGSPVSNDVYPTHTYLIPGTYTVCHTIETYLGCSSTICTDIVVSFCDLDIQANYSNITDNGGNDGFINLTVSYGVPPYTYTWNTGNTADTTASIENLSTGTYIVTVCDGVGCCESYGIQLTEPPGVHGTVYSGGNLLPEGIAIIYWFNVDSIIRAVNYSYIDSGRFSVTRYNPGHYYVYAIPYFNFGVPYTPIYFPTYYGDSLNWENANIYDTDTIEINLTSSNIINWGVGKISGNITYEDSSSYEIDVYGGNWFGGNNNVQANAAKNIPIILLDKNNLPIKFTLSDNTGYYEFDNMEYGTYTVFAEKAGYTTYPPTISIDSISPEQSDIELFIGIDYIDYTISNVKELNNNSNLLVYPNPAKNYINIDIENSNIVFNTLNIEIYNALGQVVINENLNNIQNSFVHTIDISDISNGIYIIKINDKSFKFIKN